jgi:hypothetical protein
VLPVLRRLGQEDSRFKASMDQIAKKKKKKKSPFSLADGIE